IQSAMATTIEHTSMLTVDYLAVCDPLTLDPLSSVVSRAVLLGAIRLGSVRLIDNLVVAAPRTRMASRGRRRSLPARVTSS
ncbi:MAG: hypothetical protein HP491_07340, partial [Nitrospira sp.]|nr:hypothetical protein [Nitrospira sp.]